ncbi:MAG TPA: chalcone isomerase family protein [Thermoanaerobaculia bacterium]|nr:chalcone isomerase family protein [Thermoanaerobaculia bacterium]
MMIATTLALALALPATAGTLAGVTMPDQATVGSQNLVLNGMALRSKLMFKVYVAGLYLPTKETSSEKIMAADGARHMVMHWVRDVEKGSICGAWDEGLAANTPNASAELRQAFATLCGFMADAKAGDDYVFSYVPGTGTTIEVKGQLKGTIPGKPFADALFACWIGPKPGPGQDFKKALLGG